MADKRLLFSPAAEADLEQIWHYTADTWSPEQANQYVLQIHRCGLDIARGNARDGRLLRFGLAI
ncbi:type II toxin-antitoxin system RelE/ParE family toxin [Aminobacter sp. AP02]|uniref:type II toxin-antitoxin system RelE/ParE family toxin n=1 Tax=Aminobacter sp. AP02 TaxID=2135737 RepID=UPI0032AFB510